MAVPRQHRESAWRQCRDTVMKAHCSVIAVPWHAMGTSTKAHEKVQRQEKSRCIYTTTLKRVQYTNAYKKNPQTVEPKKNRAHSLHSRPGALSRPSWVTAVRVLTRRIVSRRSLLLLWGTAAAVAVAGVAGSALNGNPRGDSYRRGSMASSSYFSGRPTGGASSVSVVIGTGASRPSTVPMSRELGIHAMPSAGSDFLGAF